MDRTITLAGKEYPLRYKLQDRADAERRLGKGLIQALEDGQIETLAVVLWAGMRHKEKKLTVEDVMERLQEHADQGGEYDAAGMMAVVAMAESKVLGKLSNPNVVKRYLAKLNEDSEDAEGKDPAPPS